MNQSICREENQRLSCSTDLRELRSVLERGEELFDERNSPYNLQREFHSIFSPEYLSPSYLQPQLILPEPNFPQLEQGDILSSKSDEGNEDNGGFLRLSLNNEYELD